MCLNNETGERVVLFKIHIDEHDCVEGLTTDVLNTFDARFFDDDDIPPDRDEIEILFETELLPAGYHRLPLAYWRFANMVARILLIVHG